MYLHFDSATISEAVADLVLVRPMKPRKLWVVAYLVSVSACAQQPEVLGPHAPAVADVRAIKQLVARHPEIDTPIVMIYGDSVNHAYVQTGQLRVPKCVIIYFDVAKRQGAWVIVSPIDRLPVVSDTDAKRHANR